MSASDLPEPRHEDGLAMARTLVTYISDPIRVRQIIQAEFGDWGGRTLSLVTIDRLREEHLQSKRKAPERPFRAHEGYHPTDAYDRAAYANERFLERLQREHPERFAA